MRVVPCRRRATRLASSRGCSARRRSRAARRERSGGACSLRRRDEPSADGAAPARRPALRCARTARAVRRTARTPPCTASGRRRHEAAHCIRRRRRRLSRRCRGLLRAGNRHRALDEACSGGRRPVPDAPEADDLWQPDTDAADGGGRSNSSAFGDDVRFREALRMLRLGRLDEGTPPTLGSRSHEATLARGSRRSRAETAIDADGLVRRTCSACSLRELSDRRARPGAFTSRMRSPRSRRRSISIRRTTRRRQTSSLRSRGGGAFSLPRAGGGPNPSPGGSGAKGAGAGEPGSGY